MKTLKEAREEARYTKVLMAERLGVTRNAIHKWENGKDKIRPAYVYAYAYLTGVPYEDIFVPNLYTVE